MNERKPPLANDLAAVTVPYTWKLAESRPAPQPRADAPAAEPDPEVARLQAQVRQLTAALEDIVTFALASADYKERAIMMHRRAVAALTGPPLEPRGPRQ